MPSLRQACIHLHHSHLRSLDGSCNNLDHTNYGRAGTVFRRELPPVYEGGDGRTPRLTDSNGNPLPSARRVSALIHDQENHTTQ